MHSETESCERSADSVNILFVDETEQSGQEFVGVGGVILSDANVKLFTAGFNDVKSKHSIPAEEEVKWSPSKESWLARNLVGEDRIAAYSDLLGLLAPFDARLLVAVTRRRSSGLSLFDAKWKCIEFVTERYQFFLRKQTDRVGIIIADFPGSGREEKLLLDSYRGLLQKGTYYVTATNIVMNLLTTESHLNPGLQVADLVVGITTAMCTNHTKYAEPYWPRIKNTFECNSMGRVMGCGLKVFPKSSADQIAGRLFPSSPGGGGDIPVEESGRTVEEMEALRRLYSVVMSEEELDLHFPRP